MLTLKLAFAGIGHLIGDYSVMVIIAGLLIAAAIFSTAIPYVGPFLTKFRADLLWCAAFIIGCLLWGAHIQHDDNLRWEAKAGLIDKTVHKATTKADHAPASTGHSRWETNK